MNKKLSILLLLGLFIFCISFASAAITTTLNSPVDDSIAYVNLVTFNASAEVTGGATLTNMSLWTNESGSWELKTKKITKEFYFPWVSNSTIINGLADVGSYSTPDVFELNNNYYLVSGNTAGTFVGYVWSGSTWVSNSTIINGLADVGSHSTPNVFELNNNYYLVSGNIAGTFSGYIISYNSFTNFTQTFDQTITDDIIWNVQACDSDGDCGFATTNRTILIDVVEPTFDLISGNGTQSYGTLSTNHTINFTVTDSNLDTCWYEYNLTNTTFTCSSGTNDFNFTLVEDDYDLIIWANDSVGNENSELVEWTYYVFEISQSYTETVSEGTTTLFSTNLSLYSGKRLIEANLIYNESSYNGDYAEYNSNKYYINYNLNVPQVTTQTNVTFYWNLSFEDETIISTNSNNQTIENINIDNCSAYTNLLFNFTSVDEDSQVLIDSATENISIKASITLINPGNSEQILNFSQKYTTNYASMCFDDTLASEIYRLDGVIEYTANNKFVEYYNFQNYSLNNESYNKSITLYNLNSSKGQEFKITYKDTNFELVPGALIQIQRKYVDEGIYKTIEIPKIGSAGYTIAHLISNDVIYNLIIIDEGVIIATFDNIVAACQNPTFTDCEININSFSTGVSPTDFSSDGTFSAILEWDKDTKIVSTTYAVLSGIPATTTLNVTLFDALGNTTVCSDSLISAGGTLSCTIPDSFGNSSILIKLISADDVKRTAIIRLNEDPSNIYGSNLIFLSVIILVTLIGMSITENPVLLGIMLVFGTIILVSLNLVTTAGWIGSGATILWLIVAIIILFIKGSNRQ